MNKYLKIGQGLVAYTYNLNTQDTEQWVSMSSKPACSA